MTWGRVKSSASLINYNFTSSHVYDLIIRMTFLHMTDSYRLQQGSSCNSNNMKCARSLLSRPLIWARSLPFKLTSTLDNNLSRWRNPTVYGEKIWNVRWFNKYVEQYTELFKGWITWNQKLDSLKHGVLRLSTYLWMRAMGMTSNSRDL
jgi:hypothetical protein